MFSVHYREIFDCGILRGVIIWWENIAEWCDEGKLSKTLII